MFLGEEILRFLRLLFELQNGAKGAQRGNGALPPIWSIVKELAGASSAIAIAAKDLAPN